MTANLNCIRYKEQAITPSKIVCIGKNYVAHIKELGSAMPDNMVVFGKPNSAVTDTLRSFHEEPIHYEGEICFLVQDNRFTAVAFGLDLTKRGLQNKLKEAGLPWERCKAFDGSALFSDFVELNVDPNELELELSIDGKLTQAGHASMMIYKPAEILAQLQSFMTLNDGDVVMTGTPSGVGPVPVGAAFVGSISCKGQELVNASWQSQ